MGVVFVIIALVLIGLLVASFFVRRHGESEKPQPGWRRTEEVFNDPSTNRLVRVWLDQSGERHYVPEAK
ncbi:MAG TPA: hypothetical protein VIJ99_02525 [Acidimicrobiales bacterium]